MFTAQQIAQACQAPLENVQATWPAVLTAMKWQGIDDHFTRIGMAATIAVETGITVNGKNMTFLPISEIDGQFARYAPWYGRGLIQCTWETNYADYGPRMSPPRDCVANPDIMLETVPSAQFAALYFAGHGIQGMANADNWQGVRAAVNGGLNGWDVFYPAVQALLAISEPSDAPPTTTLVVAASLKGHPNHLPGSVADLAAGCTVTFNDAQGLPFGLTPHWALVKVLTGHTQKGHDITGHSLMGWLLRADLVTR